jgi:hypothetical protein
MEGEHGDSARPHSQPWHIHQHRGTSSSSGQGGESRRQGSQERGAGPSLPGLWAPLELPHQRHFLTVLCPGWGHQDTLAKVISVLTS